MSRSIRGEKGCGYEYWSRRNYKDMISPGRESKKITNRASRRKQKQAIRARAD